MQRGRDQHDPSPRCGKRAASREQGDRRNRRGRAREHDTGAGGRRGKVGEAQAQPTLELRAERQSRELLGAPLERRRRDGIVGYERGERLHGIDPGAP